jgi:hypothetical protein
VETYETEEEQLDLVDSMSITGFGASLFACRDTGRTVGRNNEDIGRQWGARWEIRHSTADLMTSFGRPANAMQVIREDILPGLHKTVERGILKPGSDSTR